MSEEKPTPEEYGRQLAERSIREFERNLPTIQTVAAGGVSNSACKAFDIKEDS